MIEQTHDAISLWQLSVLYLSTAW